MKKIIYRITAILTLAAFAGMLTACGSTGSASSDEPDVNLDLSEAADTTAAETESQNDDFSEIDVPEISIPDGDLPEVTISDIHIDIPDDSVPDINEYMSEYNDSAAESSDEQTITDVSGDFTYTGALFQGGDDDNGYIKVPDGFVNFVDVDHNGLTQYSDATRINIFTLDHYEGIDYRTAANNLRAHMETETDLNNLEGATVTIADYQALQLYGRYSDGTYIVIWLIEDPANPDQSSYYLAMEFDSDHQYMVACSSTFETIADHNK